MEGAYYAIQGQGAAEVGESPLASEARDSGVVRDSRDSSRIGIRDSGGEAVRDDDGAYGFDVQ